MIAVVGATDLRGQAPAKVNGNGVNGHKLPTDVRMPEVSEILVRSNRYHHTFAIVDFDTLNVLAQPRKTFRDIEELGENIAEKGVLKAPIVGCFDPEACRILLDKMNARWRTKYKLSDLKTTLVDGEERYFVLIDGERRHRGCRYLLDKGCS